MNDEERFKKFMLEKVDKLYNKIIEEMEQGKKPFFELSYLEALLQKSMQNKKWTEYDEKYRKSLLKILLHYNLLREEMLGQGGWAEVDENKERPLKAVGKKFIQTMNDLKKKKRKRK